MMLIIEEVQKARAYRKQLGLSQADFAERFGIPLQTYMQWETGRRQPDMSAQILLAIIVDAPDAVTRIVRRGKRREWFEAKAI